MSIDRLVFLLLASIHFNYNKWAFELLWNVRCVVMRLRGFRMQRIIAAYFSFVRLSPEWIIIARRCSFNEVKKSWTSVGACWWMICNQDVNRMFSVFSHSWLTFNRLNVRYFYTLDYCFMFMKATSENTTGGFDRFPSREEWQRYRKLRWKPGLSHIEVKTRLVRVHHDRILFLYLYCKPR